jgi:hypothetical protein
MGEAERRIVPPRSREIEQAVVGFCVVGKDDELDLCHVLCPPV